MSVFNQLLNATEIILQFVLLVLLLRGPFKKYLAFSLYTLAGLTVDVIELVVYYRLGWRSFAYFAMFWSTQIALDLFLFLVVIASIYEAMGESKLRPAAAKVLGMTMAIAVVLPFALLPFHYGKPHGHFTSSWFNHTSQILNFGAAIMNLVLWGALLSNRKRDPRLVTLSIGLGIVTSTAAIAWGVRPYVAAENRWALDNLVMVGHVVGLLLWCWVFKPKPEPNKRKPAPPSASPDALTTPS